jgi:hypothetical protein
LKDEEKRKKESRVSEIKYKFSTPMILDHAANMLSKKKRRRNKIKVR